MTPSADQALLGYTVAVTADRRKEELSALLQRHGARVVLAPALRVIPLIDDAELRAATTECLAEPVDIAVLTTAIGFRAWCEAAEGWGLGDQLHARLAGANLVARGPKVRGALHTAGLTERWAPASESSAEVLDYLLNQPAGLAGLRIVVQLHGGQDPLFCDALRAAGAQVLEVPVYRWAPPVDLAPLRRLVEQICARAVDAVTFTSAPAVISLLRTAAAHEPTVRRAFETDVLAACVGTVTAAPLTARGIPVLTPTRPRLGALVRDLVANLPARSPTIQVAGVTMTIRGHAVVLDQTVTNLAPVPHALLRTLAGRPGHVYSRDELLSALPRGADEHAVEVAVGRLRTQLGNPALVETVIKRGYRLAADPWPASAGT